MSRRLENAREDAKSRRRTLRQSILDERRGTAGLSNETTPEPPPKRTRAEQAKQTAKEAATKKLEEWRRRKALAVKEMQKARPPFNPYVRVKHTGLSPYSSKNTKSSTRVQESCGASRAVLPPRTTRAVTQTGGPSRNPAPKAKAVTKSATAQPLAPTFTGQVSIKKAQKIAKPIEPSTRVLRSSTRVVQGGKENVPPQETLQLKEKNLSPQENVVSRGSGGKAERKGCAPSVKQPVNEVVDEVISAPDSRSSELQARRNKLQSEADRLRNLADEWLAVKDNVVLPDGIVDEIDAVTGQTNLLITKKFRQFEGLIDGAVTNPRTTLEDLDGFWDMVYIQVDQLDGKFRALQKSKEQNWNSKSSPAFKHVQTRDRKLSRRVGKSSFLKTLAEKKKKCEFPADAGETSKPQYAKEGRVDVPEVRLPIPASPSLDMSVDGSPFRANSSFHSLNSSKLGSTPRAMENQLRASRSSRFSLAMIRLSSLVDTSLNGSNLDE